MATNMKTDLPPINFAMGIDAETPVHDDDGPHAGFGINFWYDEDHDNLITFDLLWPTGRDVVLNDSSEEGVGEGTSFFTLTSKGSTEAISLIRALVRLGDQLKPVLAALEEHAQAQQRKLKLVVSDQSRP